MNNLVGPLLDKTPRDKYKRWSTLATIRWGKEYPKYTNLLVIAIAYSGISPLVLGFAAIGLTLLRMAFRYNIFYVSSVAVDTKGETYLKALQHITVGVYLAQLTLIGLFAAGGGSGPAKLMLAGFILTVIYYTYLNLMLRPLTYAAPKETPAEVASANRADDPEFTGLTSGILSRIYSHKEVGGFFAPFLFYGKRSKYPEIRDQLRNATLGEPHDQLSQEETQNAFLQPAITAPKPKLWIVRDDLGVSAEQVKDTQPIVEISDKGASFDEKGHIVWDQENLRELPIWVDKKVI